MSRKPKAKQTEAEWFREQIQDIFGDGAQSRFARFLIACGDHRSEATLLRTINNAANGVRKLTPEMRALLVVMRRPLAISRLVNEAVWGNAKSGE